MGLGPSALEQEIWRSKAFHDIRAQAAHSGDHEKTGASLRTTLLKSDRRTKEARDDTNLPQRGAKRRGNLQLVLVHAGVHAVHGR